MANETMNESTNEDHTIAGESEGGVSEINGATFGTGGAGTS